MKYVRPPPRGAHRAYGVLLCGQNLDAGRIQFTRADERDAWGGPVRLAARGTAGAHIAELIKTMLEKKASGIDLK